MNMVVKQGPSDNLFPFDSQMQHKGKYLPRTVNCRNAFFTSKISVAIQKKIRLLSSAFVHGALCAQKAPFIVWTRTPPLSLLQIATTKRRPLWICTHCSPGIKNVPLLRSKAFETTEKLYLKHRHINI